MTFEQTIKTYLDKRAKEDALFAETYKKEGKSIKECCTYIMQEARKEAKNGCAAIPDDVVYGWAVHYYDEDDIKVSKSSGNTQVVVSDQTQPVKAPEAIASKKERKHKGKTAKTPQPVYTLFEGML